MRRTAAPLLLVLALALGACGDDDDEADAAAAPDTASAAGAADQITIDIASFAFDPQEVEVAAGTEVVWANADDFAHTAQAADDTFDTGEIDAGTSSDPVAFDEPGTYSYFCGIHNSMTGTITVTG